jgi:Tfp pilus assembly protein PilF
MKLLRIVALSLLAMFLVACGSATKKSYLNEDGSSSIPPEKAYGYAVKELNKQQFESAVALLEIAVKQDDAGAKQFVNMGIAYSRTEQYEESLKYLTKALALAPGNADILNEIGLLYHEQGKFDLSRQQYVRALSSNPLHMNVNYNLGVLCDLYKEDLDCAIKHYKQYLASSGVDDKQVKVWLKDLAKRKKRGNK